MVRPPFLRLALLLLALLALPNAVAAQDSVMAVFKLGRKGVSIPELFFARGPGALRFTSPELAAAVASMAERSALVRNRLERIECSPYPVVVTTRAHALAFDSTLTPGAFHGPAVMIHYVQRDTIRAALVGIDVDIVDEALRLRLISEEQAREDIERMLAHELIVHVGSVAPGVTLDKLCADPPANERRMGCSVVEENLVMRSLGWTGPLRLGHGEGVLHATSPVPHTIRPLPRSVGHRPLQFHEAVEWLLSLRLEDDAAHLLDSVAAGLEAGDSELGAFLLGTAQALDRLAQEEVQYEPLFRVPAVDMKLGLSRRSVPTAW